MVSSLMAPPLGGSVPLYGIDYCQPPGIVQLRQPFGHSPAIDAVFTVRFLSPTASW